MNRGETLLWRKIPPRFLPLLQESRSRTKTLPPILAAMLALAGLIAGCSMQSNDGPPEHPVDVSAIPDAVPRFEPRNRAANPDSYMVLGKRYQVLKRSTGYLEKGLASWYGSKFHGHPTASGEPYDMYAMTAAHKTLPIPCYVKVTNLDNGRSVVVKVNDRGPFHPGRIIDLSYAAAVKLGLDKTGTAPVEVKAMEPQGTAGRKIFLQVGAFSDLDNAKRTLARLNQYQLPKALIQSDSNDAHPLFRVRVGPLGSQSEVEKLSSRLRAYGFDPKIVAIQ